MVHAKSTCSRVCGRVPLYLPEAATNLYLMDARRHAGKGFTLPSCAFPSGECQQLVWPHGYMQRLGDYALCGAIVGLKPACVRDVAAWIWTGGACPHTTTGREVRGVGEGCIWITKSLRDRTAADETQDTEVYLGLISRCFCCGAERKNLFLGRVVMGSTNAGRVETY